MPLIGYLLLWPKEEVNLLVIILSIEYAIKSMQFKNKKIEEAAYDLRFLLNRKYRKKNALEFVSNKYLLNKQERNFLARSVFSELKSDERRNKIVNIEEIEGKLIILDGYNLLITVESILLDNFDSIILCDDGVIRDLNAVFGKYTFDKFTEPALIQIFTLISNFKPSKVVIFLDSPVSFSGELAMLIKNIMDDIGIKGEVKLSKNVDKEIKFLARKEKGIVATSDSAIIDKVDKFVDIPLYILKNRNQRIIFHIY